MSLMWRPDRRGGEVVSHRPSPPLRARCCTGSSPCCAWHLKQCLQRLPEAAPSLRLWGAAGLLLFSPGSPSCVMLTEHPQAPVKSSLASLKVNVFQMYPWSPVTAIFSLVFLSTSLSLSFLCLCHQSLMAKLSSMKIKVGQMQYEKQRMEQKCQMLKVE